MIKAIEKEIDEFKRDKILKLKSGDVNVYVVLSKKEMRSDITTSDILRSNGEMTKKKVEFFAKMVVRKISNNSRRNFRNSQVVFVNVERILKKEDQYMHDYYTPDTLLRSSKKDSNFFRYYDLMAADKVVDKPKKEPEILTGKQAAEHINSIK